MWKEFLAKVHFLLPLKTSGRDSKYDVKLSIRSHYINEYTFKNVWLSSTFDAAFRKWDHIYPELDAVMLYEHGPTSMQLIAAHCSLSKYAIGVE